MTLYWLVPSSQPIPVDNAVFIQLLNGSGQIVAEHDGQPAAGHRPTATWETGDLVIDTHRIECPASGCEGSVGIEVGVYDPQTLRCLPAFGAEGDRLPFDRAMLVDLPPQ